MHKPNGQTTLLPPYASDDCDDNVTAFIDSHEVGKIPGIGFKLAQQLRAHVLQKPPELDSGLVYGGTKENVLVGDIRKRPGMGPEALQQILGGPGAPHDIGAKIWGLLNGCDDTEVAQARDVPRQISIEDSYTRLVTLDEAAKELLVLSKSLLWRMRADLLEDDEDPGGLGDIGPVGTSTAVIKRWLAFPRTLRLSTRPRPPQNPSGSRNRSFARISRSCPMPNFVFNLKESADTQAERLVSETLLPLFRRLHPEKSGWNLSLVNVAATNIVDASSERGGVGRDIGKMFKRQDDVLKQFRIDDTTDAALSELGRGDAMDIATKGRGDIIPLGPTASELLDNRAGSEDMPTASQDAGFLVEDCWESEGEDMQDDDSYRCGECGGVMPLFAMAAHSRWHTEN